ncbi:MAG: hypothetical protein EOP10_26665 [Proteobacteria bacterium]|nr:MAG: hypothetical protein EOP10_26665 [Pseudomonadota bacterium]
MKMKNAEKYPVKRKSAEYSFTLLEVIIATGLLVAVVLQVAGGQGSLLEITDYSKKATEATWLAKRVMSRVEANYMNYPLKDLDETRIKEAAFDDFKDTNDNDFKYSLTIEEWKLPLIDFLTGGGGKSDEEKEEDKDNGKADSAISGIPGLETMVNQIFDGHMMKTAHVEVSWPEGARRNSVSLIYLLTNQKKLDEYLLTKVNTWDQIRKKMDPNAPKENTPPPPQIDPLTGLPIQPSGGGNTNTQGGVSGSGSTSGTGTGTGTGSGTTVTPGAGTGTLPSGTPP